MTHDAKPLPACKTSDTCETSSTTCQFEAAHIVKRRPGGFGGWVGQKFRLRPIDEGHDPAPVPIKNNKQIVSMTEDGTFVAPYSYQMTNLNIEAPYSGFSEDGTYVAPYFWMGQ